MNDNGEPFGNSEQLKSLQRGRLPEWLRRTADEFFISLDEPQGSEACEAIRALMEIQDLLVSTIKKYDRASPVNPHFPALLFLKSCMDGKVARQAERLSERSDSPLMFLLLAQAVQNELASFRWWGVQTHDNFISVQSVDIPESNDAYLADGSVNLQIERRAKWRRKIKELREEHGWYSHGKALVVFSPDGMPEAAGTSAKIRKQLNLDARSVYGRCGSNGSANGKPLPDGRDIAYLHDTDSIRRAMARLAAAREQE